MIMKYRPQGSYQDLGEIDHDEEEKKSMSSKMTTYNESVLNVVQFGKRTTRE